MNTRLRKHQESKSLARHLLTRVVIALAILGALLYLSLVRIVEIATANSYIDVSKASTYEYITVSAQTLNDGTDESIKQYIDNYLLRANVVYAELQLNGFSYLGELSDPEVQANFIESTEFGQNNDDVYYFDVGFYVGPEPANFRVGIDETDINELITTAKALVCSAIVSLFAIFLGFAYFYTRMITEPLDKLAKDSHQVTSGDVAQNLGIESNIREFNLMAGNLEAMRQQLVNRNLELREQVVQDPLTGIPNRLLFNEGLDRALSRIKHYDETYALVMLDVDDFKNVNDAYGHPIGDRVIKYVAYWLKRVDPSNIVARIGGDEFAIIVADTNRAELAEFCATVIRRMVRDIKFRDHTIPFSVSLGATLLESEKKLSTDDFIQQADFALYAAKSSPDHFAIFDENLFAHTARTKAIARALKSSDFKKLGFRMMYQPKFDLATGKPISVEALARWQHPELGNISPTEFIALAEQQHLMTRLTTFIIDMVMMDMRKWIGKGMNVQTAINVSPQDINNENFLEILYSALEVYSVPPKLIELEVTENALVENSKAFAQKLLQVKKMGISIAIDDFGSGYANFINLKNFPFETIKIDQSFVRDMQHRHEDKILVKGAIDIAHALGMKVVAEGVETDAVRAILTELKCEQAQGMWFSSPLEADEIVGLFEDVEFESTEIDSAETEIAEVVSAKVESVEFDETKESTPSEVD